MKNVSLLGVSGLLLAVVITTSGAAGDVRLIDAVKKSDVRTAKSLLASGIDVNATDVEGSTALHWAAQRDNVELVDLLPLPAQIQVSTRYKITPMYFAAMNGNAAIIERLLKAGVDVNSTAEGGETALMTASLTGKPDAVKVLLDHGADVHLKDPLKGQTALMWAAAEGNAATVELLLVVGAELNAKSKGGFTPFLFAVREGHINVAKFLLDRGANVNDTAPDGTNALNMAVVNAYFELAAVLLDRGADPNAADPRGSALHTLAWLRKPGADGAAGVGNTPHGPPVPKGNVTAIELAEKLLKKGANPNARIQWQDKKFDKEGGTMKNPPLIQLGRHYLTYIGATPFYVAAHNGDAPYMKLLAAHGADPKMPNVLGITPLIAASGLDYWEGEAPGPFTGCSEAERIEAVKLALELGNDLNAHADFGDYKMEGDPQYLLLYYPLNMNELIDKVLGDPRWTGSTALHAAVVSGQPGIVKFLIDRGADVNAKTELGWTPLTMAQGIFFANARKDYPAAAAVLELRAPNSPVLDSTAQIALRRILWVLALISAMLVFGTLSFHWVEGWTYFEGFYMTLMTLTTVGYGEVHPLSQQGRIVASFLMMGGVAAVFISIGVIVDVIIKLELADSYGRKRRMQMIERLTDHYIVCGGGRVGRSVIRELRRSGAPILLIDNSADRAQWGIQDGIPTLVADATKDETLQRARVMHARGLVAAISSDAENVYVTLSARVLNPNLIISARATDEQAEEKLKRAGATTVFTPYTFIGHRLAQSMLRPHVLNFLDVASAFSGGGDLQIETEQLHIAKDSPFAIGPLEEARVRQTYGLIVLALKKAAGGMLFNPEGTTKVESGDVLIAMGRRAELKRISEELRPRASR